MNADTRPYAAGAGAGPSPPRGTSWPRILSVPCLGRLPRLSELSLSTILGPIRAELDDLECALSDALAGIGDPISAVLHRSLQGGKRLRPAVVLLVGRLYDSPVSRLIRLGAAAEMIHTATLIHDDLIDGSTYRRGRETRHEIWPASATVLAGDFLLGRAVSLISSLGEPRVLEIMSEAFATMSAGEIREIFHEDVGRKAYYRTINAKTASYFRACSSAAAVLAGARGEELVKLGKYGEELGLAFQIIDDVVDYLPWYAAGKASGKDLEQGLLTLPAILYLEGGGDRSSISAAIASKDPVALEEVMQAIRSSSAIGESIAIARRHAEVAKEALEGLPDCQALDSLRYLVDHVVRDVKSP